MTSYCFYGAIILVLEYVLNNNYVNLLNISTKFIIINYISN